MDMTSTDTESKGNVAILSGGPRKKAIFTYEGLDDEDKEAICDVLSEMPCTIKSQTSTVTTDMLIIRVAFDENTTDCKYWETVEGFNKFQQVYGDLSDVATYVYPSSIPPQRVSDQDGKTWVSGHLIKYWPSGAMSAGSRSQARIVRCAIKDDLVEGSKTLTIRNRDECKSDDRTPRELHVNHPLKFKRGPKDFCAWIAREPTGEEILSEFTPDDYTRLFEDFADSVNSM